MTATGSDQHVILSSYALESYFRVESGTRSVLQRRRGNDAIPSTWTHRLEGFGHQLWRVGHRRRVGQRFGRRISHCAAPGRRLRSEFYRYRRRVWRWPQRTPDCSTQEEPKERDCGGHESWPPSAAPDGGRIQPPEPDDVGRRQFAESFHREPLSAATSLPAGRAV